MLSPLVSLVLARSADKNAHFNARNGEFRASGEVKLGGLFLHALPFVRVIVGLVIILSEGW